MFWILRGADQAGGIHRSFTSSWPSSWNCSVESKLPICFLPCTLAHFIVGRAQAGIICIWSFILWREQSEECQPCFEFNQPLYSAANCTKCQLLLPQHFVVFAMIDSKIDYWYVGDWNHRKTEGIKLLCLLSCIHFPVWIQQTKI